MKIGILLRRGEPGSRLVLKKLVGMVNNEVTTRPVHPFSLLVEIWKGVEYFRILPPQPPRLWSQKLAPPVSCFLLAIFEISLTVHIPAVLSGSGNINMGALWSCTLTVYLKIGFLQPLHSGMSSFENKRDLHLNVPDVTVNMSPLI